MAFNLIDQLTDPPDGAIVKIRGCTIKRWNNLFRALWRGDNVGNSSNVHKTQVGAAGFTLYADGSGPSSSAPAAITPFDIFATKNMTGSPPTWDGTYNVTIYPGTVNGLLPTNVFSTITGIGTGTYYAAITATTDGKTITSSVWGLSASPPTAQTPTVWTAPTTFVYLFGVLVSGQPYRTIAPGSLQFEPINIMKIPKVSPGANVIPWDNYYEWGIA